MLSFIYWDPAKEIFLIPYFNWPLTWYGTLFALGFLIGYYISVSFWKRYLLYLPFSIKDIRDIPLFLKLAREKGFVPLETKAAGKSALGYCDKYLSEKEGLAERKKRRAHFEHELGEALTPLKKKACAITDQLLLYVMIATVIGARLGHILFYEDIGRYISDPKTIFGFGQGGISGLASHGAAFAILIAIYFFKRWANSRFALNLSWLRILDMVALPTAIAAVFIRVGNFINQEIIGTPTSMSWGVLFMHPAGGEAAVIRHPAQLYEALFYLALFVFLLYLSYQPRFFLKEGKFIGLFLIFVFGARFIIEFLKVEQSEILTGSFLTMGQYLSFPFILLGFLFFFSEKNKKLLLFLF